MNDSVFAPKNIVIVGASGGIGSAFVSGALDRFSGAIVHGFSRSGSLGITHDRLRSGVIDYTKAETVEAAVDSLDVQPDLIIVATGSLHGEGFGPEKSLRDLDTVNLTRSYLINTVGPALIAKHFLPLMPRDGRSVWCGGS